MPKRVFWPAALVVMGFVLLATAMGYLPSQFFGFWIFVLLIVGLGGLLISDREEWLSEGKSSTTKAPAKKSASKSKSTTKKKSTRRKSTKKK